MVKLFRQHKLLDQVYLEDLYSSEIRPLLEDLRRRIEQGENNNDCSSAVFSPQHSFDEPVMNVVFKILFGRRLDDKENTEGELLDLLNYCNTNFTAGLSSLEYFPFLKHFPKLTWLGSAMKICNMIYDIAAVSLYSSVSTRLFVITFINYSCILLQVEADKRRTIGTYTDSPNDIMDSLLKEVDEHEGKDPNYFTCKTFF